MASSHGGGHSGGNHHRVLFFEALIATGMMKRGIEETVGYWRKAALDIKGVLTGVEGDAARAYQRQIEVSRKAMESARSDYEAIYASAQKTYRDTMADAEKTAAARITSAQKAADAEIASTEKSSAVAQKAYDAALAREQAINAERGKALRNLQVLQGVAAGTIKQKPDAAAANTARGAYAAETANTAALEAQRGAYATGAVGSDMSEAERANRIAALDAAIATSSQRATQYLVQLSRAETEGYLATDQWTASMTRAQAAVAGLNAQAAGAHAATAAAEEEVAMARQVAAERVAAEQSYVDAMSRDEAKVLSIVATTAQAERDEAVKTAAVQKAAADDAATSQLSSTRSAAGREAMTSRAGSFFGAIGSGLGSVLPVVGTAALVFGGLALAIDHVYSTTAKYAAEVLRNSEVLGMNVQSLQFWIQTGQRVGIEQEAMVRTLAKFSRSMVEQKDLFKQLGVDITHGPTEALMELADAYHKSTNEQLKLDSAQKLFASGGGGGQTYEKMVKILDNGRGVLEQMNSDMQKMGLILDTNSIKSLALGNAVRTQLGFQLQGLMNLVAAGVGPTFISVFGTIANILVQNKQLIIGIAQAITNVIAFMVGFLAGIAGVKDFTIATDAGTRALSGLTDNSNNATDSLGDFTGATQTSNLAQKEHRDILAREKDALDAYKQSTDAQTRAIDDQVAALHDQVTEMENANKLAEDQQKVQDDLHQSTLAQLQDRLDLMTSADNSERRSGESLVDYKRRLGEDALKEEIKTEQDRRQTAKDTQDLILEQLKQQTDATVKNLDAQKQALQDNLNARQEAYQKLSDRFAQMDADMADAMSQNAAAGAGNVTSSIDNMVNQADLSAAKFDTTWVQHGADAFQAIRNFFNDPGGNLTSAAAALGKTVGKAFVDGVIAALGDILTGMSEVASGDPKKFGSNWDAWLKAHNAPGLPGLNPPPASSGGGAGKVMTNAEGSITTVPTLTWVSERYKPEAIIPLDNPPRARELMQQAGLDRMAGAGRSGGDTTLTLVTNYNGPVADEVVGARVAMRQFNALRRKGLVNRRG